MGMIDKQVKNKIVFRATSGQRLIAAIIFFCIGVGFALLWFMSRDFINVDLLFGPCGFKQLYGLPCPSCGMTTSAIAFIQGHIINAFYIQPAGAFLCCLLFISAFLAFLTAVFGVYFGFLKRFLEQVKPGYVIIAFLIIIIAGWMVTLSRALAFHWR
jgi:hypothetical protein